jgi:hypothetical protein
LILNCINAFEATLIRVNHGLAMAVISPASLTNRFSRCITACEMCNLDSVTKSQSAIRDLFGVRRDRAGNLPQRPAIFPDQIAPIIRIGADGERELVSARWGMPGRRSTAGSR